jgi:hypothetical protein
MELIWASCDFAGNSFMFISDDNKLYEAKARLDYISLILLFCKLIYGRS